ncbi:MULTISPECIES: hypothetical protein [Streptomyces]|nr:MULTISPECIES: hypothetical protein [Streptomyces]MDQ0292009.1 hypothetical protein [Streptomyces sp. DSM 41037]
MASSTRGVRTHPVSTRWSIKRAVRVDEGERPDRVSGVERLGFGQVLRHVGLDELDVPYVYMSGDGALVLG